MRFYLEILYEMKRRQRYGAKRSNFFSKKQFLKLGENSNYQVSEYKPDELAVILHTGGTTRPGAENCWFYYTVYKMILWGIHMHKKSLMILKNRLEQAIKRNDLQEAKRIMEIIEKIENNNFVGLTGYPSIDKPQNIGESNMSIKPIIPPLNIYNTIKALNIFYKNEIAIECNDVKLSYKKLFDDSATISLALKELGVKQGQIIAVSMPNLYQAVEVFLACNRIGAITTFLNYYAPEEEVISYLNTFETPVYFNYGKQPNENIKKNTNVNHIITLNKSDVNNIELDNDTLYNGDDYSINYVDIPKIAAFKKFKLEKFHSSKEDALILFTSGTTGKPKSVVLTNENIISAGIYLKNSSHIKKDKNKRTLVCVPFTYPYGFSTSTLMTLMSNKTAILAPNMSKDTISEYLKLNPNIIFGSPALLELIMKNVPKEQDLSSIKQFISGGDFLTLNANERGKAFFMEHGADVELGNGSGNAETVSCGTNPLGVQNKPSTAGKILVGTEAMIVDPNTFDEKKYGEEGLMIVSGKHVFKKYYNNEELTKDTFVEIDGKPYFKTGTMGYVDEDGYFTITGRQSRFYIMDSLNKVYLDKVQGIINRFECVSDCAVVPVQDNEKLTVNKAYILLNEKYKNVDMTYMILELCKNPIINEKGETIQLKKYEIPSYIEFVDELPRKQGTEKIDYSVLEQDAKEKHCIGGNG